MTIQRTPIWVALHVEALMVYVPCVWAVIQDTAREIASEAESPVSGVGAGGGGGGGVGWAGRRADCLRLDPAPAAAEASQSRLVLRCPHSCLGTTLARRG